MLETRTTAYAFGLDQAGRSAVPDEAMADLLARGVIGAEHWAEAQRPAST